MDKRALKFKLFACCIPVKGVSRSVICDIQRDKIKLIPNALFEILDQFDGVSPGDVIKHYGSENRKIVEEYYSFLIENEFGFLTETPDLFPSMDLAWETPCTVSNGIIDYNENSNHNFEKLFNDYESLGCKHIQLRFFSEVSSSFIISVLDHLEYSSINSVELVIKYTSELSLEKLTEIAYKSPRINNIIVHSSLNNSKEKTSMTDIVYTQKIIDSSDHCGNISRDYFVLNQDTFLESLNFNSCLNKKISVDVNGDIKNCPSMKNVFGNISTHSLEESIDTPGFTDTWKINKDQIDTCKECEFRHICTDCRAFHNIDTSISKPVKCSYDPKTMIWAKDNKPSFAMNLEDGLSL